jgi:hypothetical protein
MYKILPYTHKQAKRLHVIIHPSTKKQYKIDVYDAYNYNFIASVGAIGYSDYPTYIETHGKKFALERRRLYKIRHEKDRHLKHSRGYYADQLLW